jgi:hypothetical protein
MPLFLPAGEPIVTCTAGACEGCPVRRSLKCHFGAGDLLPFLLSASPAFVLGAIGIAAAGVGYLALWGVLLVGCFGVAEIRVLCSHCPHYAERVSSLRCWANYGSPKLWRYRPGPMSRWEKTVFFGALASVAGYPLLFMLVAASWALLAAFLAALAGLATFMAIRMCGRCMNFACPANRVSGPTRQAFIQRNPGVVPGGAQAASR